MPDVIHQSASFFDDPAAADRAILPLQVGLSDPTLPTLEQTTGLLSPDRSTSTRLSHLDPDLYDLRDTSHLVRFLKVLLGDAGAGQLRKRLMVARLQATMGGTHFYDLDGFYGSLFGARRRTEEHLPFNPMTGTATPDEWDDITTRDAKYRERIYALAKAMTMAGTVDGLRQAAEALTGVECDVYETWRMLEAGASVAAGHTWDEVEGTYDDWNAVENVVWNEISGAVQIGRAGVSNPDEVVVRPKRDYTPADSTTEAFVESQRQRAEDEMAVQRVLTMIKPAGVLLTVDEHGLIMHTIAKIAAIQADSNFWQVLVKVIPKAGLSHTSTIYRSSIGKTTAQPAQQVPFANSQTHAWSYNANITAVGGFAFKDTSTKVTADGGTLIDKRNWERVPATNGRPAVEYRPGQGLADQRMLLAAQAAVDSILQAHPYSSARVPVATHG